MILSLCHNIKLVKKVYLVFVGVKVAIHIYEFVPERRQAMERMHCDYSCFPSSGIKNNTVRPILPANVTLHYIQASCPGQIHLIYIFKADWKII